MLSKLSMEKYPLADPSGWLVFNYSTQKNIDPVFSGRLAALAKYMNKQIHILSGRRTTEEQIKSYIESGGYQDKNGNWVGGNGYAAKPGNSWHEFGQAIDTSDTWLKQLEKDESTFNQKTLNKFGLYKPLTKGNRTSIYEDWHLQPIETLNVSVSERKTFAVFDEIPKITEKRRVIANTLNVRLLPTTNSNILGQLKTGDTIVTTSIVGDWIQFVYDNNIAYVYLEYTESIQKENVNNELLEKYEKLKQLYDELKHDYNDKCTKLEEVIKDTSYQELLEDLELAQNKFKEVSKKVLEYEVLLKHPIMQIARLIVKTIKK